MRDTPEPGNLTLDGWRFVVKETVVIPAQVSAETRWTLHDWNMILLDQPDGTPGRHYHRGTAIICTVDPADYWPELSPEGTWLWTSDFSGSEQSPTPLPSIQESWTGCGGRYVGVTADAVWWRADPNWAHMNGKAWIRD